MSRHRAAAADAEQRTHSHARVLGSAVSERRRRRTSAGSRSRRLPGARALLGRTRKSGVGPAAAVGSASSTRRPSAGLAFVRRGARACQATTGVGLAAAFAGRAGAIGRPGRCARGSQDPQGRLRSRTGDAASPRPYRRCRRKAHAVARIVPTSRRRGRGAAARYRAASRRGVGVLAAGKPLRSSPEPLASVAGTAQRARCAAGNADAELGGSASADGSIRSPYRPTNPRARPAQRLLPAHQVAGQIVAAAHAIEREGAQPTGTVAAKPAASSVVKVLRLELQPADLGTITIRMSLKQDGLDIRVEASRHDTAACCRGTRTRWQSSSRPPDIASTAWRSWPRRPMARPSPDGRSQAFLPSSTPQQGGSSQPDSRSSGGRPNAEPDPRSSRGNQNDDNDKSRIARGAGGDLYV